MTTQLARLGRVPTHMEIVWPALLALRSTGMSATISEHAAAFIEMFAIPEAVTSEPHGESGRTELEYRLAWARTALKRAGLIENSARGVWSVTEAGAQATDSTVRDAVVAQRNEDRIARSAPTSSRVDRDGDGEADTDWRDNLLRRR